MGRRRTYSGLGDDIVVKLELDCAQRLGVGCRRGTQHISWDAPLGLEHSVHTPDTLKLQCTTVRDYVGSPSLKRYALNLSHLGCLGEEGGGSERQLDGVVGICQTHEQSH